MILREFIEYIKNVSLAYPTIKTFGEGDIYETLNSGNNEYPCIFLTIESISSDEDAQTLNGTIFYVDRLLDDSSNKLAIQTVGLTALKSIKEKLEEENYINFTNINYTPFTEKFSDMCAGMFAQCSIQLNDTLECDSFELATLTVKENGLYSTIGYKQVVVDVTRVRTLGGYSGDIGLGDGLNIEETPDGNVLVGTTIESQGGNITLGKGLKIDENNVLSGVNPTFEAGDNITITHTATEEDDNYRFDVPDMRYDDSIGAFKSMEKLNKYLYSIEYNTIDYSAAKEHYKRDLVSEGNGACSVIRTGNLIGRNFDYTINHQVEFVLKTKASGRLYSVTGIATAAAFTTDVLESNTYIKDYLYLPFRLVDGINEKGLVCSVNELPKNTDPNLNISINGNTPTLGQTDSISMIMLVRYILDRFEYAIDAATYIKQYVNVYPILGTNGEPLNYHFTIADKNNTVYLYFYGDSVEFDVFPYGEEYVLTNFRRADTTLVDGHYSVTDSDIEAYGQGIERANTLIDFTVEEPEHIKEELLDYLYRSADYLRAYKAPIRLTDFTQYGSNLTIDNTVQLTIMWMVANRAYNQEIYDGDYRDKANLYQTVHSIVYDIANKTMMMQIQEIEDNREVFNFTPYPRVDFEFTPTEIIPTTTNFVPGTPYSIYNALQRIANLFAGYWNYIKTNITDLIPSTASSTNQLADKSFVNETVAQNAANFRGNWNTWDDVPTDSTLYPEDYSGNKTPTNNDYLVVSEAGDYPEDIHIWVWTFSQEDYHPGGAGVEITSKNGTEFIPWNETNGASALDGRITFESLWERDTPNNDSYVRGKFNGRWVIDGNIMTDASITYSRVISNAPGDVTIKILDYYYTGSWRFLYQGEWSELGKSGWKPAYRIGSAFTDAQQAAIDSTITLDKVNTYDSYESRIGDVETDKRDRIYTANKIYATDSDGKDIALDIATIQAHNYASLTNKPTINGVEVVGSKTGTDYKLYTKTITRTGTSIVLTPNEYIIASASSDVTVILSTLGLLSDGLNEYRLQLSVSAPIRISFTDPDLKWTYDKPDYLVSGKTYEISIINKHATYLVF